ncbi:putative nuclease HARBI1, partial [Sinocyclocheilus rhinocerous]|uniref:putative nuclease HARBI1 n=1 Tax=Sinocyclocheilus rhinocerous TaxID=307959 RepID=UPI0007B89F0B
EQSPTRRYTQINDQVPILVKFFSGDDLRPAFRLSRNSINMLVQMLPRQKAHGWSHEIEVLVTVYWLACGASYRVTSDTSSMPLATVCRTVHNVVEEMMTILHKVINFPKPEEMEEVGADFAGHEGTCDAKGTFKDVYTGNPGSVHDALILRRSPMYQHALYPPAGYFLLGDGGYPCLQHPIAIMTPYCQPVASQVEARYNRHHALAINIIECTFGMLKTCHFLEGLGDQAKTRWHAIFLRALEIRPLFAPKVIGACCILHNICVMGGDLLEEEESHGQDGSEDDMENAPVDERDLSGNHLRGRLAAQLSSPEELPACLSEHDYI